MPALRAALANGRWHFQHGPIDLVIGADGDGDAVRAAHAAAWRRFQTVLSELVDELVLLRTRLPADPPDIGRAAPNLSAGSQGAGSGSALTPRCPLRGAVAQRMWWACRPYARPFITPMAAVAGSVAQELIGCYERRGVARAWVNNGGDIALHLAPGTSVKVGLFADLACFDPAVARLRTDADFVVDAALPVRGIATSGWRGRSHSLGIADSVTVLAGTAAQADAAATVIANAVDVDDARIVRRPASTLTDDSDLGDLEVTVDVPALPEALLRAALQRGECRARELQRAGLIHAAMLVCQHRIVSVESKPPAERRAATPSGHGLIPA